MTLWGERTKKREEEFVAFAQASVTHLNRLAFLLCHDWHLAEDLTQQALTKTYVAWRRHGQPDAPFSYARQVQLRCFLDQARRRSSTELSVAEFPAVGVDQDHSLRLTLIDALGQLPPRDRAIVVLRYWEDLPIHQVADVLGLSSSVVTTQSHRALRKLRELLATDPDFPHMFGAPLATPQEAVG